MTGNRVWGSILSVKTLKSYLRTGGKLTPSTRIDENSFGNNTLSKGLKGTGNSVGNVRGFEERPKPTAFLRRGSPTPKDHREIKTWELLTVRNELLRVPSSQFPFWMNFLVPLNP